MTRLSESKYGNKFVKADGYTFASGAEHRRYEELKLLEKAGEIIGLRVHTKFSLFAYHFGTGCEYVACYVADFDYRLASDPESHWPIIEDVKGARTSIYKLKKAWFEAQNGVQITEIEA